MRWLPTIWKVIYDSGDGIKHIIIKSDARPEVQELQSCSYAIVLADSTIYLKSMYGFEPTITKIEKEMDWE